MRSESSTRALEVARAKLDEQLKKSPDDPKLLMLRGRADERLEQYADAARFFRRAATLLQRTGDVVGSVSASIEAARAYARAGDAEKAKDLFEYGIARYDQLNDTVNAALTRVVYAQVLLDAKLPPLAQEALEMALEPLEAQQHWEELGWALERLTEFARAQHEPALALDRAKAAVECAAKAKNRLVFGRRLAVVAALHLEAGRFGKARQYQERAQGYLREEQDTLGLLAGFETLAAATVGEGELERAEALLMEAIEMADKLGKPRPKGRLRVRLAELVLERDEAALARDLLEHAVALLHTAGDPWGSAPAFVLLGRACWKLEQHELALRALQRAEALYRAVGDEAEATRAATMHGQAVDGRWAG
jgi:tetratricopeptide (TPR) repeat protein